MTEETIAKPGQPDAALECDRYGQSLDNAALKAPRRLLLDALRQIRYGTLTMITPEGSNLVFSGSQSGPTARLQVYDWRALDEIVSRGQMGFAEAYLDGKLDSNDLAALLTFFLTNLAAIEKYFYGLPWHMLWMKLRYGFQSNSKHGSRRNIAAHYNLGNDFYRLWLDESMTYSCALFEGDAKRSLEEAQAAKYRRILRRLDAKPGEHLLEIGCGWGGFAEAAAYEDLRVTAITLSEPQADYARTRLKRAGIDNFVKVELTDYREVRGQYDHIVSIGMFEHVGEKYWPEYFTVVRQRLKPEGRAMIQSITLDDRIFEETKGKTGFIEHYIFPGGMLPSPSRFRKEAERAGLVCHDTFSFGQDYKRTLEHWLARFEAKTDVIRSMGRDEFFIRLWRFYLSGCIAAFATNRTSVMQVELRHAIKGARA